MAVVVIVKACYVCQIVVNMNIKIIAWHLQFSIDIYMHLYSIVVLGFGLVVVLLLWLKDHGFI